MKKVCLVFWLIFPGALFGQYWGDYPREYWPWIDVKPRIAEGCDAAYTVMGGVSIEELDTLGLLSVGSGRVDYGYFSFDGEWWWDSLGTPVGELMWPPSLITPDMVWAIYRQRWFFNGCWHCGCENPESPPIDSLRLVNAFGFWYQDPNLPQNLWLINRGYIVGKRHIHDCRRVPCPFSENPNPKITFAFTDSAYEPLADNAILSGDSPLYMVAFVEGYLQSLSARLWLGGGVGRSDTVGLMRVTSDEWRGSYPNSRLLGMKSFAVVKGEIIDGPAIASDFLWACLPQIHLLPDTVVIKHDSMKVRDDMALSLKIINDAPGREWTVNDKVASAAYKYKSVWVSSENFDPLPYYRQHPLLDTSYIRWNGTAQNCQVTIDNDALYAVGGMLTIECRGYLDSVPRIDNSFFVRTDTLGPDSSWLPTKRVLIDADPTNSLFRDYFLRDRIRAVAWNEGAGIDPYPPHEHGYNRWNHYWPDTQTPCENRRSTATGIMQMLRRWWWEYFEGSPHFPDTGYTKVTWDSLGWNWRICIRNGKFIHDVYYANRYKPEQKLFPDSCSYGDCGLSPKKKNKEDLRTYAYTTNLDMMQAIQTDTDWNRKIRDATTREAIYVKDVRRYTYEKPWNQ